MGTGNGNSEPTPSSFFVIDLALATDATTDLVFDVAEAGLEPVADNSILSEMTIGQQRRAFTRWCADKPQNTFLPFGIM